MNAKVIMASPCNSVADPRVSPHYNALYLLFQSSATSLLARMQSSVLSFSFPLQVFRKVCAEKATTF